MCVDCSKRKKAEKNVLRLQRARKNSERMHVGRKKVKEMRGRFVRLTAAFFLSRPNWTVWCVCVWMCWLGSAPLRTSHSKSYGWWFSYSFFQTHTWFNSNSIFFCFLPFVLFRHHTILFSLCFGEGTFSLSIFYFLKREFSFFLFSICLYARRFFLSFFIVRERVMRVYVQQYRWSTSLWL